MAYAMDDIKIVARHLAQSLKCELVFEDGACPATDGKQIILPTDLNKDVLFELLATLLHETFHIRYSDMDNFRGYGMDEHMKYAVNVLEDIRIDHKAMQEYPQARGLYKALYDYVMKKHADKLKDEPLPYRVMKHMIVKAKQMPECYYDDNAVKAKHGLIGGVAQFRNPG